MKIICKQSELSKAIAVVSKAVAVHSTMASMKCILITAENDEIRLTANNNELGIETIIDGTIEEEGIVALDAKFFSDFIRKLPDNDVRISVDEKFSTSIICESTKVKITGKPGDDFASLPEIEKTDAIEISQFALKEIIRQTIFSISDSENNVVMTGELFKIKDNKLQVVSLDGHRVSIRNLELKDRYEDKQVIVPGKTLIELSRILPGEADEIVQLFIDRNHIAFLYDQTVVISRLIEGEFINVQRMISSDYETKVKVRKKEMYDTIDRASLFVREGDKKPIVVNINDDVMEISMNSFVGAMNEEIEIEKEGKNLTIGFNPNFFIDVLRVIDDEDISLYMINQKYPCFIKDEKESYIYMILPVNFTSAS